MIGWFTSKKSFSVEVDMHSHLIPGIDDGVKDLDESLSVLRGFQEMGYKKVITTPHIYPEFYPNTPETILSGLTQVKEAATTAGLHISIDAAAEYFIDSELLKLLDSPENILSFGRGKYVLIETPFTNKPLIFDEVIFKLKSQGFQPILAHPERYTYLQGDLSWLKQIKKQGVLLQVTSTSLIGAYGRDAQKIANQLLKWQFVDFVGSDLHRKGQLPVFQKSIKKKYLPQKLKNDELI